MEPQVTSSTATIDSTELRAELLGRLGLPPEATDADVAAAHRGAKNLLEHAPDEQKAWAADQLADVEAVTSLLADLPSTAPAAAVVPAAATTAQPAVRRHVPRWVWAAAAVVVVAGVAFGMHSAGSSSVPGITGTPTDSSSSSAAALDQAQVGALMQKITANPKDTTSLASLAAMYFQAADYKNSALFSQKVLAVDPKQVVSWVALGAAQFNEGDQTNAKQSWLKAVALNPKNVEAHYDLGFLYLSGSKPDVAAAKKEWSTVIAIDPKSDIAKTVQTHLQSLSSASPSPSASK
jgi:cytochrome c-type biogenesis protein CcmH/NrfG